MFNLYDIIRDIKFTVRNSQVSPSAMATNSSIVSIASVPGGQMSSSGAVATPDSISSVEN